MLIKASLFSNILKIVGRIDFLFFFFNYFFFSDFIFLGSKITGDGDCSHEIKRQLLLESKAMTKLDSIVKSRDITLTTKVHLVKAMVLPVVMYGFECWSIKKDEH